ncbi:Stage V sporulation protein AD [Haloplasma contractile SSD-17B]|uniref:Stage V sporulation protein AD n=1 Tax=Haloplasma contractile SSD-17B TaxID=1033810 RepID=U2ECP5_9MOLU|nr:stage V sporulation protein AD [Haloplasma contractile]ERJ12818.1 Stage V sporulation protein AD [Haloplasma contractile SSD-17B]
MAKAGKQSIQLNHDIYLQSAYSVVGPLESEGPLKNYFDKTYKDNYCGEDNWEKAEQRLLQDALENTIRKGNIKKEQIDLVLAGDLINQTVISNYVMRDFEIPFMGMYGACSTSMETLLTAALLVDGGNFNHIIAATSSHNSTAERQFRYPTEYVGQKPHTLTYTVTGSGAALVSKEKSKIKIDSVTIGKVIDAKQSDPNDMGTAMAPAASDTIIQHLKDLNRTPDYYDLIVTGDLSKQGQPILLDIMNDKGYSIDKVHNDCGLMIYSDDQPTFSGGSGCACCAVVTYGYIKNN